MNDTFIMAPVLMIGTGVIVVVILVIAGISIARYVVRKFDD